MKEGEYPASKYIYQKRRIKPRYFKGGGRKGGLELGIKIRPKNAVEGRVTCPDRKPFRSNFRIIAAPPERVPNPTSRKETREGGGEDSPLVSEGKDPVKERCIQQYESRE